MFVQSLPYENHCEFYKKARIKIVACAIYTYQFFFLLHNSSFLWQNKNLLQSVFSVANQTTYHHSVIYIQRDCSSAGICFNVNNKRHILPIVCTMLISIIIVLLKVKRSTWYLCLNFKMSKFTLQLNKSYQRPQFSQAMSRRLRRRIQNSIKHIRWSILQTKQMINFRKYSILDV